MIRKRVFIKESEFCENNNVRKTCARYFALASVIAFVCIGIMAFLLPLNSIAYAKASAKANVEQSVHPHNTTGLHMRNIAVMPNQRTVRTQGEYMFTKKPVSLLITFDGISASTAKNIRKVTVNVGKYQIANSNAEFIRSEVVSSIIKFRYQLIPNVLGIVKVELQKEGIYDLRDISARVTAVKPHFRRILGSEKTNDNSHIVKQASFVYENKKVAKKRTRLAKPILGLPEDAWNIGDFSQNNASRNNTSNEKTRFVVIDNTAPRMSVNYDNKTSYDNKYFRANRSARIIIKDNFFIFSHMLRDSSPIAKVVADGNQVMKITAQHFKNDGVNPNIWYADIPFARDASWDVQYNVQDLSGNFGPSQHDNFVIDTQIPAVTVSGVKNGGAYAQSVMPTITIKDRWLKPKSVTYSLRRMRFSKNLLASFPRKINNQSVTVQYAGFYNGSQDDDVYELKWSAKDAVNHVVNGILRFSINSIGSTFTVDSSTLSMNNRQLQNANDVRINEINPSGLAFPAKVSVIQDGVMRTLSKNDFAVNSSFDRGWQRLNYTIFKRNFADSAHYRVRITSMDKAGNRSCNDRGVIKKEDFLQLSPASVQFTVDNLAPLATVFDMKNNAVYKTHKEGKVVKISAKDNVALQKVTVNIDGETKKSWRGKEANKSVLSLKMKPDGIAHDVLVKALDYAGNSTTVQYENVKVVQISHKTKETDAGEKKTGKNKKDSKENNKKDGKKESKDAKKVLDESDDWIANSQVREPANIAMSNSSLQKKSANYLAVIAYICIGILAIFCSVLGFGILHNKNKKPTAVE